MKIDPKAKGCLKWGCGGLIIMFLMVVVLPIVLINLTPLHDSSKTAGEEVKNGLASATAAVEASEREFEQLQQSADFADLSSYAERDNWSGLVAEARSLLNSAQRVYDDDVGPILERNKFSESTPLDEAVKKLTPMVAAARDAAPRWSQRRDLLVETRANADEVANSCETYLQRARGELGVLKTTAARVQSQHESASEEIGKMIGALDEDLAKVTEQSKMGLAEYAKHKAGQGADYLTFANTCASVPQQAQSIWERGAQVSARFAELDHSYSKTLVDMRADYALVIRRQSWDNAYDYPPLHDHDWTRTVDGQTFDHFDEIPGSLATVSKGFFGTSVSLLSGVDQARWDALKIDAEESMAERDDEGEIWLQEAKATYFHKYFVTENGESSESDWVPVAAAFFLANLDNLGMDVESKPYGVFESDKLTEAAPPGMSFVGNERYGRWQSDGRGGSVWNWIGPYLLYRSFFGSPYGYGRGEWNTWRGGYMGSRPYYGGTSTAPAWGTRGRNVQTSPRMQGSQFARGGGFQRASSSVRGAGPGSRGGGFGGSGK